MSNPHVYVARQGEASGRARMDGGRQRWPPPICFSLVGSEQPLADNESVKETLKAINNTQADGVIGQYAIGAVGSRTIARA